MNHDTARHTIVFKWNVVKKTVKIYFYTLKILHFIPKLNFVAHGVKFGVLKIICTYVSRWLLCYGVACVWVLLCDVSNTVTELMQVG